MVKAIAFDFGGTLFSTGKMGTFTPQMHEAFISSLMDCGNLSREDAESVYSSYIEAWKSRRARGESLPERETSSLDLLQHALAAHGIEIDSAAAVDVLNSFHRIESDLFLPLTGVLETLPRLHENGYRLFIASNNPWSESIVASLRRFNIDHLFEEIVVSCDVGYRKPHSQMFSELLRRIDLAPSQVLFVGDSYLHDIETPKSMGMKTCLVDFEGRNKNSQLEHSEKADLFLTQFPELLLAANSL
ncbi:MAG: HAD family hydrolase [Bdellovibrionaceae bacterium]|nr:HAD family hydrolase [Pseudobdellovibrionaceae bacterium]